MLLRGFSYNTPKMNTFQNSSEQVFLSSHLLCWLPLLPYLCLPFFFYFMKKAFIHSSSAFLRHSKEKELYSFCQHPSKHCKVLRKWQEAWLFYFSVSSSSFLFFVFLLYLDCQNLGKTITLTEYLSSPITHYLI